MWIQLDPDAEVPATALHPAGTVLQVDDADGQRIVDNDNDWHEIDGPDSSAEAG